MAINEESPATTADEQSLESRRISSPLAAAIVWAFPDYRTPVRWLTGAEELIGRDPSCSIELPSKLLSRRHARIKRTGDLFVIQDLESRNGVHVNGKRVQSTVLAPGDTLRLGEWVGTFTELAPTSDLPFTCLNDTMLYGPTLAPVVARARALANSALSIVLEGETGTGKELFAREVHAASERQGAFVPVNCATYQRGTAAAELFGYRRGAFTGAERAHEGHVQAARGGTLFLDEIAELDLEIQAQLLRLLQEGEIMPLGEARPVHVDLRFISATQRPLSVEVEAKRFRPDLRARLEGAVLKLPPLRERPEEIGPLFLHLLKHELEAEPEEMDARIVESLYLYDWPLNVRELSLLVKKLAVLHRGGLPWSLKAMKSELPTLDTTATDAGSANRHEALREEYDEKSVLALVEALERHHGNVSRAAAELSISRQRAYRLLKAQRR